MKFYENLSVGSKVDTHTHTGSVFISEAS